MSTSNARSCASSIITNLYLLMNSSSDRIFRNCKTIPTVVNKIPFFNGFRTKWRV